MTRCLGILLLAVFIGLASPSYAQLEFRQEMRNFVQRISEHAKQARAGFLIIPQNGQELLTNDAEPDGPVSAEYKAAIDGSGREDLFYGYNDDDIATPAADRDYLLAFTDLFESQSIEVLVTDYCSTQAFVDDSYAQNEARGYVSFAADDRELRDVPAYPATPHNVHSNDVTNLSQVKNFLYLINPGDFDSKVVFLDALRDTNYDLILIDLFFNDNVALTAQDVASLRTKSNGGARLVICYMSIGEAEDYRYYWKPEYDVNPPTWLDEENDEFPGNFKVRYWLDSWQDIILDAKVGYLARVLDAGFDGVYLDLIEAYEFFEENPPIILANDIDGSGEVNAVDVQLVINAALGIVVLVRADVNGIGGVDAVDVQLVINGALGL